MPEEKQNDFLNDTDDFFNDVIEEPEVKEEGQQLSDEEQRQKNKNAEEARKRREREAKEKQQQETPAEPQQPKEEEKPKEEPPQPPKDEKSERDKKVEELGRQLYDFQTKYPDVDIATLDKDVHFKNYLEGKLLGKKNFTELYEEYVSLKTELSGKEKEAIINEYLKKQSSSGSSAKNASQTDDVYSEDELNEVATKLQTMNPSDAKKVREKFYRSLKYYENKK